ncbi:MAG: hypothetical protein LBR36_00855 [Bacteroidales bacterium]|nr:hypothetical protein [Bacteroidales bacterium]
MVDKISQNLKYSNNAGVMCRKGALSVARLGEDAEKYTFAMQLSDYQAFTPPPNCLIIKQLRAFEQLKIKSYQFKIINRLIHDFNNIYLIFKILCNWTSWEALCFINIQADNSKNGKICGAVRAGMICISNYKPIKFNNDYVF